MNINKQDFLNPPKKNRPYKIMHSWTTWPLNQGQAKTIDEKVEYLDEIGFGGVVTNVEWTDDYLKSDADFAVLNQALDKVSALGMGIWIYDEHLFPSGSARQLTCEGHPELEAIGVGEYLLSGSGTGEVTVAIPKHMTEVLWAGIYAADGDNNKGKSIALENIKDKKLTVKGIAGDWVIKVCGVMPVFVDGVFMMARDGERKYPNLLSKAAVARFVDVTYETYKKRIPNFSKRVEAFFTDEPCLASTRFFDTRCTVPNYPLVAWEETLPERFAAKFGYDLCPFLPCLFAGDTQIDKQVRQNYYEIVGDTMRENFSEQVNAWCEKNGTKFSGHLLSEENYGTQIPLCGDMMKVYDGMGYPGVDILDMLPQHFPNHLFALKMVQSSAKNNNKDTVMAEMCPLYEWARIFPSNHHEYALGFMGLMYLCGINHANHYYSPDDHTFSPNADNKKQAQIYNAYVGRLNVMLKGAVMNSSIGVLNPTQTAQQYFLPSDRQVMYETNEDVLVVDSAIKSICFQLTSQKIDYTLLTEDYINRATLENGYLNINGNRYSMLILPKTEVLPLKTMKKLDEFVKRGGKILFTHCLPSVSDKKEENEQLKALVEKYRKNLIFEGKTAMVTNLAEGAKITITNEEGSITTGNIMNWTGKPPAVAEIDLGAPKAFDCVAFYMNSRCEMSAYNVDYLDGDVWKNIVNIPSSAETEREYTWSKVIAQKIKITINEGSIAEKELAHFNKVEVYNSAEATGAEFINRVRDAFNIKLQIVEENIADEGKLMLAPYMRDNSQFYMLANADESPVSFTIKNAGTDKFNIYNPYDGSVTTSSKSLTIPGYRALFIEPIF